MWYYSSARPELDQATEPQPAQPWPTHRREHVLPDGSTELVINLDGAPRKRFDPTDPRRFDTFRRAWVSGPQPEFILIDVLPQATMMGAHFKPAGLAAFLQVPVHLLAGEVVELDQLWGPAVGDLRDMLLETSGIAAKFSVLESFLRRRLQCQAPVLTVAAALRRFLSEPDATASIAEIAGDLGVSHKHLIHCFRAEVGLSPKRFRRIQRFQRTLRNLRSQPVTDWADMACAAGYYDQAHLINDFRELSGLTPVGYLQHPGADNRFVPIA